MRQRAAHEMIATAQRRARFFDAAPGRKARLRRLPRVVNGFTGCPHLAPDLRLPADVARRTVDAGYADFAERWRPILDAFDRRT